MDFEIRPLYFCNIQYESTVSYKIARYLELSVPAPPYYKASLCI